MKKVSLLHLLASVNQGNGYEFYVEQVRSCFPENLGELIENVVDIEESFDLHAINNESEKLMIDVGSLETFRSAVVAVKRKLNTEVESYMPRVNGKSTRFYMAGFHTHKRWQERIDSKQTLVSALGYPSHLHLKRRQFTDAEFMVEMKKRWMCLMRLSPTVPSRFPKGFEENCLEVKSLYDGKVKAMGGYVA